MVTLHGPESNFQKKNDHRSMKEATLLPKMRPVFRNDRTDASRLRARHQLRGTGPAVGQRRNRGDRKTARNTSTRS
jgi:hypothetical protein